jgi:hypothetical protein
MIMRGKGEMGLKAVVAVVQQKYRNIDQEQVKEVIR